MRLYRQKSKPGSAVQRFGRWQNGEPQVIMDNHTWLRFGKPDYVDAEVPKTKSKGFLNTVNDELESFGNEVNRILNGD